MIEQLMTILKRGGALSIEQVARELDTTPELVIRLILHLERMGQLKELGRSCEIACGSCPVAQKCFHLSRSRIWQVVA